MKQRNWLLISGMILTLAGPLCVTYFGLALIYLGTLLVAGWAFVLWIFYFYIVYLLAAEPHDKRYVQICVLILSILTLPWSILLIFAFFASATKAHNAREQAQ